MDKKTTIKNLTQEHQVEAILLCSSQNRYWFSRFASSLGYILITKKKRYLFLDGRYITAARSSKNIQNIDYLEVLDSTFWIKIRQILTDMKIENVGFESDWVTYQEATNLKKNLSGFKVTPIDTTKIRMIKDAWEVEQISQACKITHKVFESVLAWVKPGITEQELARFVSDSFLKHGAQKLSFDTIVASGENGAMPHAVPTNKRIQNNELITLDMGCYFEGYASDQTRTFAIGKNLDPKLLEIYQIVYDAQSLGISLIKPGVMCREIHNAVASFIEEKGFGQYFTHGLGHGLGIEIHEEPYENTRSTTILKPGMVITVEPGIYVPGVGGVRIEDDFLVTPTGSERLTLGTRNLIFV